MTKKQSNIKDADVHPYPQDITADPFIVFGGLFSRKVIQKHLSTLTPSNPKIFHDLVQLANQCNKESMLQQGMEKSFNEQGIKCSKISAAPTCDRLIGSRFLVEIKLDKNNNDPQFWQGSGDEPNAVLQTRRYLNESKERDWALLTNGKVIRLMHKNHGLNFIDLWICDTILSGETPHATLFEAALKNPSILDTLLEETSVERERFTKQFSQGVQTFWDKHKKLSEKEWNVSLVEAVLCTAFHRYLEDVGILPVFDEEYKKKSLLSAVSRDELVENIKILRSQKFLTSEKVSDVQGLFSDRTLKRIKDVLSSKDIFSEFKNIFWKDNIPTDISDLKVAFFGDAYQLFANKTDINGVDGQYFTGSELARETAIYFVEDERRGIAEDEVIYDPFVGSGQLLRALVPFFHLLLQGELLEPSIISGMRKLTSRLVGTDVDDNACWLARLSLSLVTAERGKPLMDLSSQIIHADVFKTCFGYTESKWQEQLGFTGNIRGIITNPPWRRLRQTSNELYTIETGNIAPLKKNKKNWKMYQAWLKDGGRDRANAKAEELKVLSEKHRETFPRAGQREVNVSISALDFVDRIRGSKGKKWVAFMPDCFFVGQNDLRKHEKFSVRRYYSYPFNDHFEGTDNVMKFGVVFGGGSKQRQIICHPMGKGKVDVTGIAERLEVLPIFGSTEEAIAQAVWFNKANVENGWHHGEFHETEDPKRGASLSTGKNAIAVRGAKKCNDKTTYSCIFNTQSVSFWTGWVGAKSGSRVLVRDKRSNTRKGKVLWAGLHTPGKNGVPDNCAVSNAWNYLSVSSAKARAIMHVLNTPLADTAMRSIGSKRNINPKDLIKLGLPDLSDEVVSFLNKEDITFVEATATIFVEVFNLNKKEAESLLKACGWVSSKVMKDIIAEMDLDVHAEASKLTKAKPKRAQLKKAAKALGQRSNRK